MSQGARTKQEGEAAHPGAAPASAANPGRGTLTGGLEEGNGLPYRQKSLFESSVGRDLSGVRVHTDDAAAEQADAHDARAFAVGQDIHFAKGEYKPGTREGDQLLAHEVAHTVQQSGAPAARGEVAKTTPGDRAEKNADTAAASMVEGKPTEVTSEPIAIARKARNEDVAPPPVDAPAGATEAPAAPTEDGTAPDGAKAGSEEIGELTAERVGAEEEEGGEPVGAPQNLEQGKNDLAAKGEGLPADGGAEELKGGAPKVEGAPVGGGGGSGGGGDVQMTSELSLSIAAAQDDAKEGAAQAQSEATAYKGEMRERRDRFENEQNALTLESLKTMPAADKRATLIEMGYDKKAVKKMKDAQLDGIIAGRVETEQRQSKILGMEPDELAKLGPAEKMKFLEGLGIESKDLNKIGPQKAAKAFDDVMRVAHIPGQHKVKVKVKGGLLGKSWELSIKVDAEGQPEIEAKKKGGFLSKLWGWVKAALPIIAVLLVPLTGGASLIALSVYQTVTAIATGDWMGAIVGAAGAIVGIGALQAITKSASGAAKAFKTIANVAGKVKNVAVAAKTAMIAAKAKSPGGLLAALASGASAFADFAAGSAEKFGETMNRWAERLDKWAKVIGGGEKVIAGIKTGDPAGAIAGAFDAAAAVASKPAKQEDGKTTVESSKTALNLQKYSRIAGYASAGTRAAKAQPPDYGAVVDAAMSIAGELKTSSKLEAATRITSAASRLTRAIQTKDPGALAAAALGLAEAIQLAKIGDGDGDEGGVDAKKSAEDEKEAITRRYAKATSIVKFASAAITAATTKPRPDYASALNATTQLIADLTDNKKLDQAAVLTQRFDAWTAAVRSKNEMAIIEAGRAFGEAINGMKDIIITERDDAKKAAQAKLAAGEQLEGDDGGNLPSIPVGEFTGLLPGTEVSLSAPPPPELTGTVTTSEELKGVVPNYSVVPGDTFSGIAQRFNTTVSVLQQANPTVDPRRMQIGQRIFVPGAEVQLTPSVTVKTDIQLPGQGPLDNIQVPPGGNAPQGPDSGNANFELPAHLKAILDVTRIMADGAKYFGHPGGDASFDAWDGLVKAYDTAFEKKDATAWQRAKAGLQALSTLADFKAAWSKEFNLFQQYFQNVDETDASKLAARQGLQAVGRFKRNIARVVRVGGIFPMFSSAADHVVMAAGYNADLSGAEISTLQRVEAARLLAGEVQSLVADVQWAYGMASRIFTRLGAGQAFEGYAIVQRAANRYGDDVARAIMTWVRPVLDKMAKEKGAQWATQAAQRAAAEIAVWGAEFAASTSSQLFRAAATTLASKLGSALKFGLSPQFAIAFEIVKLELQFANYLWTTSFNSLNIILSQHLYGSMIQVKKAEVRGWSTASNEEADQTIRRCYSAFSGATKSWPRQGWPNYVMRELQAAGKFYAPNATSAEALLARLAEYWITKPADARLVRDILLKYIDHVWREEFKVDPPA